MKFPLRMIAALLPWALLFQAAAQEVHRREDRGDQSLPRMTAATEQMLGSYQGQNVVSIEIAGRPDLTTAQFEPLFAQQAGQPFSKDKVMQTAAAVKAKGNFSVVRIQVNPQPNGVGILLILEPGYYFGIYQFPGASVFS